MADDYKTVSVSTCKECLEQVRDSDKGVECNGCGRGFRVKCADMTPALYAEFVKFSTVG